MRIVCTTLSTSLLLVLALAGASEAAVYFGKAQREAVAGKRSADPIVREWLSFHLLRQPPHNARRESCAHGICARGPRQGGARRAALSRPDRLALLPAGTTPRAFWGRSPKRDDVFVSFRSCPAKLDRRFDRVTSLDFVLRDDVGYPVIAVLDLFDIAWIARVNGRDWFGARGQAGQTTADGFAWVEPLVQETTYVPEYRESCLSADAIKGGKSWVKQPDDVVRALACASLAYPDRFGRARASGVTALFQLCPLQYMTSDVTVASAPRRRSPSGNPVRLDVPADETRYVESLAITFEAVVSDSPCPEDATCIWPGDAMIELHLHDPAEGSALVRLHTLKSADAVARLGRG